MTVEREPYPAATCDKCGDRLLLDLEPDAEEREIQAALAEAGWIRGKPEKQAFPTFLARNVQVYENDLCGDCQSDDPAPRPKFVSRPPRPRVADPLANDPCDEWPRSAIFKAVGLRPDCGHPPSSPPEKCGYCERGFPIGRTDAWWRR